MRRVHFAFAFLLVTAPAVAQVVSAPDTLLAPVVRSARGMVVSGSPIASAVGARILEQGGNAVDAAVATAFALSVVEPTMSGIGGRTQLLIRTQRGEYFGIDGGTAVPSAYPQGTVPPSDDAYGYQTIGVPGTVHALATALARHGTLPLARVLAPAVELARNGFILSPAEAARIANDSAKLTGFDGARRYFLKPNGATYRAGERLIQSDLARTLESIARDGARAFYTGAPARQMVDHLRAHGNWLQLSDLQNYAADESIIVRGSYRGYDLIGTYLPASGVTTIETLHILENFDLAGIAGTTRWAALLHQALLLAFDDRIADLGSPEQKAATLVSKAHARTRANRIRIPAESQPGNHAPAMEGANTTHLSVADAHGGVAALTQSLGPNMGSRVAAPGLGFLYAATMGYLGDVKPGDRPFSSQSPLIVTQNGELRFALGGAGARRIIPAIVAVLSRTIDEKLPFPQAMAAPRLHALPERMDMENRSAARWTEAQAAELRSFGFTVRLRDDAPYFARIHAIHFDPATRQFVGVADPRWEGAAAAPRR
ncbi:MAG: gamma-glutamyltransferase family protein [Longimicrobiales bacterium]